VTGDHPIAKIDPAMPPEYGVGWLSSPAVEVTFALSPTCALLLNPGDDGIRHSMADASAVRDINLRTFASAEWTVYAPSHEHLARVAERPKQNSDRVAELAPRSPVMHVFEGIRGRPEPTRIVRSRPSPDVPRGRRRPRRS
jgi:hypothetical protein